MKTNNVSESDEAGQTPLEFAIVKVKGLLSSINLIEVLIIALIIAISIAVIMPLILHQKQLAEEHQRKQQVTACQQAADRSETLPEGCAQ